MQQKVTSPLSSAWSGQGGRQVELAVDCHHRHKHTENNIHTSVHFVSLKQQATKAWWKEKLFSLTKSQFVHFKFPASCSLTSSLSLVFMLFGQVPHTCIYVMLFMTYIHTSSKMYGETCCPWFTQSRSQKSDKDSAEHPHTGQGEGGGHRSVV